MNRDEKEIINDALKLIEENLCDPNLKPSWLAKTLKVDLPNFCKKFKKVTGVPCTKYVAMRRVDAAKDLLKDGIQVKQIAGQIGYKNSNYFSRVFKKITGLSPQAYRSCLRNQKLPN